MVSASTNKFISAIISFKDFKKVFTFLDEICSFYLQNTSNFPTLLSLKTRIITTHDERRRANFSWAFELTLGF